MACKQHVVKCVFRDRWLGAGLNRMAGTHTNSHLLAPSHRAYLECVLNKDFIRNMTAIGGNKQAQFVDKTICCYLYNALAHLGGKISYPVVWNVATIFLTTNHASIFPTTSRHVQNKTFQRDHWLF